MNYRSFFHFPALFGNTLLLFLLRLKNGKKIRLLSGGGKNTILSNNPISFLGMMVIIVLINSISDLEVISFLPSLDSNVSNEAKLH